MATKRAFDVIIVGGGIAGFCLASVLARGGFGVLVVEKESRFRDRVRGEGTWPWGVAHALKAGLGELFAQADVVPIRGQQRFDHRQPAEANDWAARVGGWRLRDRVLPHRAPGVGVHLGSLPWRHNPAAQGRLFASTTMAVPRSPWPKMVVRMMSPPGGRGRWQAIGSAALGGRGDGGGSGASPVRGRAPHRRLH